MSTERKETIDAPVLRVRLWAGRVVTALCVLFLLFDGGIKALNLPIAVEATAQLGYPASAIAAIGIVLLVCTVLYVVPATSMLGAVLLTGYLGGAVATQVRLSDPWFLFPVFFGVLVWTGLYLRNERLRALVRPQGFGAPAADRTPRAATA